MDRTTKFFEYQNTPAVQRYIIIEQSVIGAEVFSRGEDSAGRLRGAGLVIDIPQADIRSPIDELYDGSDLAA